MSSLKEKDIKKLKSIIKKLKKKKKNPKRVKSGIEQKVTQKIIFQKGSTENNSRPFPQILQQHIPSSDTDFLRSVIMQQNNNPLTRIPVTRVPNRPSYDLADQYGLNLYSEFQPTLGIAQSQPIDFQETQYLAKDEIYNQNENALKTPNEKSSYIPDNINDPPEIDLNQPPKRQRGKGKTAEEIQQENDAKLERARKKEEERQRKIDEKEKKQLDDLGKRRKDNDSSNSPWKR